MIRITENAIGCSICNKSKYLYSKNQCEHMINIIERFGDLLYPITLPEIEYFIKADYETIEEVLRYVASKEYIQFYPYAFEHFLIKLVKCPEKIDRILNQPVPVEQTMQTRRYIRYLKEYLIRGLTIMNSLKDIKHLKYAFPFVKKIKTKLYHPLKNNLSFGILKIDIYLRDVPFTNIYTGTSIRFDSIKLTYKHNIIDGRSPNIIIDNPTLMSKEIGRIKQHPHANPNGSLCLGDYVTRVISEQSNLFIILANVLNALQQYNPKDCYEKLGIDWMDEYEDDEDEDENEI